MVDKKKELKSEELIKIAGGNEANETIELIKHAIYRGSNVYVYVSEIYDNKAVSHYGASLSNDIYKYGGILKNSTVKSFCNMFDVKNPITNVVVEPKQ